MLAFIMPPCRAPRQPVRSAYRQGGRVHWIFANAGSYAKIGAKVGIKIAGWPQSVLQSEKSLGQKLRRKFKINRLREDDMPAARHAICRMTLGILSAALVTSIWIGAASAQDAKHYRFAYDQPKTTGYGIAGDLFANKLKELSNGSMLIDQYPGGQLGQEPQVLQLVKAGDVEFCISSSANAATLSPQAGVMSLHFLFRNEAHLVKAIADPEVSKAVKAMIAETVQGARVIGLATLGLRDMYSKREVKKIDDIKGLKVRVQATPTEDVTFPAYGA